MIHSWGQTPQLTCNYDRDRVGEYANLMPTLQVPLQLVRNNDPRSFIPTYQKKNILLATKHQMNMDIKGMRQKMIDIDYKMLEDEQAPELFFQSNYERDYRILENKEIEIMVSNPSGIFSVCLEEVFADS